MLEALEKNGKAKRDFLLNKVPFHPRRKDYSTEQGLLSHRIVNRTKMNATEIVT
jgi:hypothetical protein